MPTPVSMPGTVAAPGRPTAVQESSSALKETRARARQLSIHVLKSPTPCERVLSGHVRDDDFAPVAVRLERYTPAHRRALDMAEFIRTEGLAGPILDGRNRSHFPSELEHCGSWLRFDVYPEIDRARLSGAFFCNRWRLCPFCALRRVARSLRDNTPRVMAAVDSTPEARLCLLTLTVRGGDDLPERFDHIASAWRQVIRRRRRRLEWERRGGRARPMSFGAAFAGGVYAFEVKRGGGTRGGGWHPHLHACVAVDRDTGDISREWQEITGDSHVVDLRPFHSSGLAFETVEDEASAVASDLAEVLKYPLKFNDVTLADNWLAEMVLAGRRLRGSFGSMYGIVEPDSLLDDDGEFDGPFVQVAVRWLGDGYVLEAEPSDA